MEEAESIGGGDIVQAPQAGKSVFYRVGDQRFPTVDAEGYAVLIRSTTICAEHLCLLEYFVRLTYRFDPFDLPVAVLSLQGHVQNGSSMMGFPAHPLGSLDDPLQSDFGRIP